MSTKGNEIFGFPLTGWLYSAEIVSQSTQVKSSHGKPLKESRDLKNGQIFFFGNEEKKERSLTELLRDTPFIKNEVHSWILHDACKQNKEVSQFFCEAGPVWIVNPKRSKNHDDDRSEEGFPAFLSQGHIFSTSPFEKSRDLAGLFVQMFKDFELSSLLVTFDQAMTEEKLGFLVGLEIGFYKFLRIKKKNLKNAERPRLLIRGLSKEVLQEALTIGVSVNLTRHLVNTPANELTTLSYVEAIQKIFSGRKCVKVHTLDEKTLKKEKMGLLLGVGQAAGEHPPRLVHIQYRPVTGAKKKDHPPIAFVGKGITYDTGGLDIKTPEFMRNMKKDMAGSAALIGVAHWMVNTAYPLNCDFYLALAENSIDNAAMRPGDILVSRSGLTVEVHNTDAEGRLVLADAINYAVTKSGEDRPVAIIDIATLTAAMRIALGADLAGICSNHEGLASAALKAGHEQGDLCWRLPLFPGYDSQLKSYVADLTNAPTGRNGGAITAALFLQRFVQGLPWLHFDIYGWADRPFGTIGEIGASGQGVQCLIGLVKNLEISTFARVT